MGDFAIPTDDITENRKSVHKSLNLLINVGNILGILPITDYNGTPEEINFDFKSSKCFYSYFIICLCVLNAILCFIYWTIAKFNFYLLATQMYYINSIIVLLLYLKLGKNWSKFMKKWSKIDENMNKIYGFTPNLDKRIKIQLSIIIVLTIAEFLLFSFYTLTKIKFKEGRTPSIREYYEFTYPHYFFAIDFNYPMAVVATISLLLADLIWSFNDLFIICISTTLALRFKQITKRLERNIRKTNSNEFWFDIRKDYDLLVYLTKKLDDQISHIVLLSFSANIFFLLIQLSNTVGNMQYNLEIVYYSSNFSLIIYRLISVSLYSAWINDESKEPCSFLNSVPSATYNSDIKRFLLQISFDDVGISGSRMFKVTRGLILSVAGAIVTYELVVIQFNKSFMEIEDLEDT